MSSSSNANRWRYGAMLLGLALSCFICTGTAQAEPSAADKEAARDLYVEGMDLRDAGKNAEALQKFKKAYELVPTPITALAVGSAYETLGKLVEARELYLAAANSYVKATESPEAKTARAAGKQRAQALRSRIPTLTITLTDADGVSTIVSIDSQTIPSEELPGPHAVNPGPHVVVVASKGRVKVETRIIVAEGDHPEMELELGRPLAAPDAKTTTNPLVYWGFGGAGVALVGGLVMRKMGNDKYDACKQDADLAASGGDCPGTGTLRGMEIGAYVLSGVGVGIGIYGLLNPPGVGSSGGQASGPRIAPWLGWRSVGIEGAF